MRLEKIDLNLFVVFDAIYRERSVTRVAAQLNLTQPAVSNALGRLRQTFDDPLFVRTPQGMAPTPVADNVVADVRKALTLLRDSVGVNARFDPGSSEKVFRLAMNDMVEALLLPKLQQSLAAQAPGTLVNSYYTSRDVHAGELKSGTLDLLLDVPEVNARELGQQPLAEFRYVLAMRPGHALAGKPVSLEDYLAAPHVHVSSRRRGRGHADIALHALGQQRRVALRVQNYYSAARVAAGSDLLWTAPEPICGQMGLVTTTLPFEIQPLAWNLYWHRSAEDDPANRWLRGLISGLGQEISQKT